MRPYALFLIAGSLLAQKMTPVDVREINNRAAPFEKLQNDIGSAVAHASRVSQADRAKLDQANLVLGQAIADRREQHKVDKKKILAALKDIESVEAKGTFTAEDRKALAADRKRAEAAAKEPTQVNYVYVGKPGQPF